MRFLVSISILVFSISTATAQTLYSKAFGIKENKAIIFLHGGPGYNCANFEVTTAQELAEMGFYVIIYDRRGEGRSIDPDAKFTFKQTFDDLMALYQQYGIEKSTLMGHSFGGVVATLFAEAHPGMVDALILVAAPVSLQATFKNIIAKSKTIYQTNDDKVNLNYISMLESMDPTSIEYSAYCFAHAMQNGFYSSKTPTDEAKVLYAKFKSDTVLTRYASQMSYDAPQGFWKNEHYTTIDLATNLKTLGKKKIAIYGLYGKEDGLYSSMQVAELEKLIGSENLKYFPDCSHSVFVDQQSMFLNAVANWMK